MTSTSTVQESRAAGKALRTTLANSGHAGAAAAAERDPVEVRVPRSD